jgi:chromosomal replication initiation ATPase DnaA
LNLTPNQIWRAALNSLRLEMNHSTFDASRLLDTWIAHIEGEAYHIAVANQYARDWLDNRLNATVTRVLKNIVGHDVTVRFVAPDDPPAHS